MAISKNTREWHRFSLKERFTRYILYLGFALPFSLLWHGMDIQLIYFSSAPAELADLFERMVPPDWSYISELIRPAIKTVHIAVVGTAISVVCSIPVVLIAAENLTPNRLTYALGKFIISFSRSVDPLIYALIFVLLFGPGALAGMFAVGLNSLGFISKVLSEEIEEIDDKQLQAIKATGASPLNQILYGIIPQIKAPFIGVTIYRWDVNIRSATVIGLVGAGGIGGLLQENMGLLYWNRVLTILMFIMGLVAFSEVVSAYFRAKIQ